MMPRDVKPSLREVLSGPGALWDFLGMVAFFLLGVAITILTFCL